ncbi:MAG: hypothetical protein IH840_01905 [Candidatus Heimdallarchaeota archaeon]|nr:hypothetical protein [Candidatus Heimdallarchaeota archaeon]
MESIPFDESPDQPTDRSVEGLSGDSFDEYYTTKSGPTKIVKIFAFSMVFSPFFSSAVLLILFSGARPIPVLILSILLVLMLFVLYTIYFKYKLEHHQLIRDTENYQSLEIVSPK